MWKYWGKGPQAGVVKRVSDPSPGPSRFIWSRGRCGGGLGVKGPGRWWVGSVPVSGPDPEAVSSLPIPAPGRMILSVLTGLLFGSDGYYVALAWTSSALMYFTVSPGCPCPSSPGWSWDEPPLPATPAHLQLSFLPGALFANGNPGS